MDEAALAGAFGFEDPEHLLEGSSQGGDEPKAQQESQDVPGERTLQHTAPVTKL